LLTFGSKLQVLAIRPLGLFNEFWRRFGAPRQGIWTCVLFVRGRD
jgi:hypothetical protein